VFGGAAERSGVESGRGGGRNDTECTWNFYRVTLSCVWREACQKQCWTAASVPPTSTAGRRTYDCAFVRAGERPSVRMRFRTHGPLFSKSKIFAALGFS
jgi:hypothetical protein